MEEMIILKIKHVLMALISGILIMLCGCSKNSYKILSTAISQIDVKANGLTEQLHDYDSPYTICYKNKDNTYSLYIFASPIQYKTKDGYEVIDNTVIKSGKYGFAYENKANNIKTYFPKSLNDNFRVERDDDFIEFKTHMDIGGFSEAKQIVFTNMYGNKISAVVYEHKDLTLVFYPTKAGISLEAQVTEKPTQGQIKFKVNSKNKNYKIDNGKYISLMKGD